MELNVARIPIPATLDAVQANRLASAIAAAASNSSLLVLEGTNGTFCRGMDLAVLAGAGMNRDAVAEGVEAFGAVLSTLRTIGRPVIALVDGATLGGGVGIAAAADLVLATRGSTFALPEGLFGLIPAVVLPALLDRVTPQAARLMVLRARAHSAEEAHALGLVDVLVEDGDLVGACARATRELSRVRPDAIAALKRFSARVASMSFFDGIAAGCAETIGTLLRPEVQSAVRAFVTDGELPWT